MSKRWRAGLSALGVVLVLAVCGISSYLIVLDEQAGVQAQANTTAPKPTAVPVDISNREVDPVPLTTDEVFPGNAIVIDPSTPDDAYTLIGAAQELTNCNSATEGEINKLIADLGCSQVIRATMKTPPSTPGYVVTGGIMNLASIEGAEQAYDQIRPMVREKQGRFVGYVINSDKNTTKNLALSSTAVGWTIKGHYLAYCVIARIDGTAVKDDDPYAQQIMFDIVQFYLKGIVLENRAFDPVPADGSGSSASPAPSP
jgi:hypothetical protein